MMNEFVLPKGLIGRFAVVKLWPEIKTAEDECIARLKITAHGLGLECIEIHADGRRIDDPANYIDKRQVDFVLHLHYDTPKFYDAFSFVALWNPTQFYHEWGYARTSRNLLTHDDFVSCSSSAADDHVGRMVRKAPTHLAPFFKLYHSTADIVHAPTLGDGKLFYAGINWEAISGGKSRHQEVLKRLDQTGQLRIYGPEIFQNVRVWAGYQSYVRGLPFDGISMIDEIAKAGIALVLSSAAHKRSELMSNRLFESVAAGAVIICDENPFAKRFFGDSLLYIDTRHSIDRISADIERHLAWIGANPAAALAMANQAQAIFRAQFSLTRNVSDLYRGLTERKQALRRLAVPDDATMRVQLNLLLPDYSEAVLNMHVASVLTQDYAHVAARVVLDQAVPAATVAAVRQRLQQLALPIDVAQVAFYSDSDDVALKTRRPVGAALADVLRLPSAADAVLFVAPNEKIYANHVAVLVGSLLRNPGCSAAASATVLRNGPQSVHGVHERVDFRQLNPAAPIGYGRFLLRVSMLAPDLGAFLPYLDRKAMAVLVGEQGLCQELPATLVLHVESEYPSGPWNEGQENELLTSFSPDVFAVATGCEIVLPPLEVPTGPVQPVTFRTDFPQWGLLQLHYLRRDGVKSRVIALSKKVGRRLA